MKINEFTGGLNEKIDPSLLPTNASTKLVNVDISSGVLKSLPTVNDTPNYTGIKKFFFQHKGLVESSDDPNVGYTEYANDLYFTESGILKQKRNGVDYTVGLPAPTTVVEGNAVSSPEPPDAGDIISVFSVSNTFGTVDLAGDLPNVAPTYRYRHRDHLGRYLYTTYVTLSAPVLGGYLFSYGAPLQYSLDIFRDYLGTFRLVGTITSGGPPPSNEVSDSVYDISGNPSETDFLPELKTINSVDIPIIDYEYINFDSSSGTLLESEPFIQSLSLDNGLDDYFEFRLVDPTKTKIIRSQVTDTQLNKIVKYYLDLVLPNDRFYDPYAKGLNDGEFPLDVYVKSTYLDGFYTYVTTFYNSVTGYESQPSPLSDEIQVANGIINISDIPAHPDATEVRLYRVGGTTSQFSLVVELPIGTTTYIDKLSDLQIPGTLLISDSYNTPPLNLTLLTEANGVLLGAIDSTLHFSIQGLVFAWPLENFITFKRDITCIQEAANGIIVTTDLETYVITGSTPKSYAKYPVSGEHGCQYSTSYQKLKNGVILKANTGLIFTSGGGVSVMTEKFFSPLDIFIKASAVHNNTYYAVGAADIFIFNLTDGNFYTVGLAVDNIGVVDGKVHVLAAGELRTLFTGSDLLTLEYKSPVFTSGSHSEMKVYRNMYIALDGTFTISIYLDGILETTRTVTTTNIETIDLKVPQSKQRALDVQVEIVGSGTVYEYEWKDLGRQNGR